MKDTIFQVAFEKYFGQACLAIHPLVGQYFDKKGQVLNKYGVNMSTAALPGHDHSVLHNKLQFILQAMMKLDGIPSEKEAANFILDKVGYPCITAYVTQVSSHTRLRGEHHTPLSWTFMLTTSQQADKGSMIAVQHILPRHFLKLKRIRHAIADTSTTTKKKDT